MIKPEPIAPDESASGRRLARSSQVASRYRRSQVFGLLLIAAIILAAAIYRAEPHTLFTPGWWR